MLPYSVKPCRISIHRQIIFMGVLPALVMVAVSGIVLYQWNIRYNYQILALQGQMLTTQLARALEYVLTIDAREQIAQIVQSTTNPATQILEMTISEVAVTDSAGQSLYQSPIHTPSSALFSRQQESSESNLVFSVPIILQPVSLGIETTTSARKIGQVTLRLSLEMARTRWYKDMFSNLLLVTAIFSIATGLAYSVGRRLSGAITKVAQAIQNIEQGHLSTRLPQTDINELGTLQLGVNLLAQTLEQGQSVLELELSKVRGKHQEAMLALEQTNQNLAQVNQELAQASEAKSLFLAKMSHEMRTPMCSVLGSVAELMREEGDLNKLRMLRNIQTASKAVNRQVDDILHIISLTKKQASGEKLPLEPVHLLSLIETTINHQESLMVPSRLYMDYIVADNVPDTVESNNKALEEIIANLIGNAVKYTKSGGIVVKLERFHSAKGDWPKPSIRLQLTVSDTGCGIPEEKKATIFNEFEQVDEAYNRRHGGTGLGLAFVKKNCELLGGHVDIESQVGVGTTFIVNVPVYTCDNTPSWRTLQQERLPDDWRALVVDERLSFRQSITSRLNSLNIPVEQRAISPVDFAKIPIPTAFFEVLVIQNIISLGQEACFKLITGLRRWANILISFESDHSLENQRLLRQAGIDFVFWSGISSRDIKASLLAASLKKPLMKPIHSTRLLAGRTILLVDDDELNRSLIGNQLKRNGADLLEAANAETAITIAAEPILDLILMDIQMPDMDGITAIKKIRQLSHRAHLTIAGFTAYVDERTKEHILEAGADVIIPKLLDELEFIRVVDRILKQYGSSA